MEELLGKYEGKKGQLFIAGSVIMLVGFIMLKNLFVPSIEERVFLESNLLPRYLDNILNEYSNIAGLSSMQSAEDGISHLSDFSFFIRDDIESRIFYVFVFANSSGKYSVTVGNFLDEKINVTLSATGSSPQDFLVGVMEDKTSQTREFTAISDEIELTVSYKKGGHEYSETLPLSTANNFVQGFFDISLEDDMFIRKIHLPHHCFFSLSCRKIRSLVIGRSFILIPTALNIAFPIAGAEGVI